MQATQRYQESWDHKKYFTVIHPNVINYFFFHHRHQKVQIHYIQNWTFTHVYAKCVCWSVVYLSSVVTFKLLLITLTSLAGVKSKPLTAWIREKRNSYITKWETHKNLEQISIFGLTNGTTTTLKLKNKNIWVLSDVLVLIIKSVEIIKCHQMHDLNLGFVHLIFTVFIFLQVFFCLFCLRS